MVGERNSWPASLARRLESAVENGTASSRKVKVISIRSDCNGSDRDEGAA